MKPETKEDFYGQEFDWLAVDKNQSIGYFSTAGYGPVPLAFSEFSKSQDGALEYIKKLPRKTLAIPLTVLGGDLSDWFYMAKRGIYTFDFQRRGESYKQLARPAKNPLQITCLPEKIRSEIEYVIFNNITFEWPASIKPSDYPLIFGT